MGEALFKVVMALTVGSVFWSAAHADQTSCRSPDQTVILKPALGYEVAGTGRLYFHFAPTEHCVDKKIFVVPRDRLVAYEEYGSWTWVAYKSKGDKSYEGWVYTSRLKFVGTEGNTDPNDLRFYEKAMKAANAGKLGSPWDER